MPAIFPRWTNTLPVLLGLLAPAVGVIAIVAVWYWFSPEYTDVGYRPAQPVQYSHKLHAGELGIDCRYCHSTVERSDHAAIPPTSTCMNCHQLVKSTLEGGPLFNRLAQVRRSDRTGAPIPWVRVHQLPDYAYFSHQAHVASGVGCVSCHGRVDQMEVVELTESLSMSWCLECHRDPKPSLRPVDQVANMGWDPATEQYDADRDPKRKRKVDPPLHCSGCHR